MGKNLFLALCCMASIACGGSRPQGGAVSGGSAKTTAVAASAADSVCGAAPQLYTYRVARIYPHATDAYTQGLYWHAGHLWEGTGQYGQSVLRQVDLESGATVRQVPLPEECFGEGTALLNGKIYQLTWREGRVFVYDAATLRRTGTFRYRGEGWGLATDGRVLYMSDGSDVIRVVDPDGFRVLHTFSVRAGSNRVRWLNELEWIGGELWANVYMTDRVVRIDPATGCVTGVIDFSGLLSPADMTPDTDVLNGIAYDADGGRIFVTGKYWNKLFEVEVVPQEGSARKEQAGKN